MELTEFSLKALKRFAVACQPMRFKILKLLRDKRSSDDSPVKGLYINQIAEKISEDRVKTSFHLTSLEENGLVNSKFDIIVKATHKSKGRAGRFYVITTLGAQIFRRISETGA